MSFIRNKEELRTGIQEKEAFNETIDLNCDFVMVYGVNDDLEGRAKKYREEGYVVHLMTGIAWGDYQDYLLGDYDGTNHEAEGQMHRDGTEKNHGKYVPYMVPINSFARYLVTKLSLACDYGIFDFHLEEPEFWGFTGYSKEFQQQFEIYYQKKFVFPHENIEAMYECNKLKAYLYAETLNYVAREVKEYALKKYQKQAHFYVPTHSLLNYSQWNIISPESLLQSLPYIDGYIAQIWTGTSREPNHYQGVKKERTFETAFLEYSVMQELVRGSNKKMWFLNDPIEDNPTYTWENYKFNYERTLTASLLHSHISLYEICPWPNRVFNRMLPEGDSGVEKSYISESYDTFLNNIFQTLGDMQSVEPKFMNNHLVAAVALSDSAMYQRMYPDNENNNYVQEKADGTFNDFYGLALPMMKQGIPVNVITLENIVKFPNYLDKIQILVLSYEYMKPLTCEVNFALYRYVLNGGILLFVGNNDDPYHNLNEWWKTFGYETPYDQLKELMGTEAGKVGKGYFYHLKINPNDIALSKELSEKFIQTLQLILAQMNLHYEAKNYLCIQRNQYVIGGVLEETLKKDFSLKGNYIDLFDIHFKTVTNPIYHVGEVFVLFDPSKVENYAIIGSTKRVVSFEDRCFVLKGKKDINVSFCFKLAQRPLKVMLDGHEIKYDYCSLTETVKVYYHSNTTTNSLKIVEEITDGI